MLKAIITATAAGSIALLSLASIATAEPSEGKSYGKCPAGAEWSHVQKKCIK